MNEPPPLPAGEKGGSAPAPWAFGAMCVLLGLTALLLASGIRSGFTDENDLGPAALPRVLGALLLAGGVIECVHGVRTALKARGGKAIESKPALAWIPALIVTVLITLYVALLPWAGFGLSTFLFATGFLTWLGAGWRLSLGMAAGLILFVVALFRYGFDVILPAGYLGLPL